MCMIVKDESDCVRRCLESCAHLFADVVIVDTGSTDNTPDIAREFTDRVFFHEWENDFSKARNQSLSYAACDWVFIIDADEVLDPEAEPVLKEIFLNTAPAARTYFLLLINYLGGEHRNTTSIYHPRIFWFGDRSFHYSSIVHNQPSVMEPKAFIEARLHHYGYSTDSREKLNKKAYRTLALLNRKLEANPDDLSDNYHIIKTYNMLGMYEQSFNTCRKVFRIYSQLPEKKKANSNSRRRILETGLFYFTPCNFLNRKQEYISDVAPMVREFPDAVDLLFNCCSASLDLGNPQDVERYATCFKKAVDRFENKQVDPFWMTVELRHRFDLFKVECMRGISCEAQNNSAAASLHYTNALRMAPDCVRAGLGLMTSSFAQGIESLIAELPFITQTASDPIAVKGDFVDYLYNLVSGRSVLYLACVVESGELKKSFSKEEIDALAEASPVVVATRLINRLLSGKDADIFPVLSHIITAKELASRLIHTWTGRDGFRLSDPRFAEILDYNEQLLLQLLSRAERNQLKEPGLAEQAAKIDFLSLSTVNRLKLLLILAKIHFASGDMESCFNEINRYTDDFTSFLKRTRLLTDQDRDQILQNGDAEERFILYHITFLQALDQGKHSEAELIAESALRYAGIIASEYRAYCAHILNK